MGILDVQFARPRGYVRRSRERCADSRSKCEYRDTRDQAERAYDAMADQYLSIELRIPKSRARSLLRCEYTVLTLSRHPIRIASASKSAEFTGTKIPYSASVTSVHRSRFFFVKISIGPVSQS